MWQRFSEHARMAVFNATTAASTGSNEFLEPDHLLYGLLMIEESTANQLLEACRVDVPNLRDALRKSFKEAGQGMNLDIDLSLQTKRCIDGAYDEARENEAKTIEPEHLLLGIVKHGGASLQDVLKSCGVEEDALRAALEANNPSSHSLRPRPASSVDSVERSVRELVHVCDEVALGAIRDAAILAIEQSASSTVALHHLAIALARTASPATRQFCSAAGIELDQIAEALAQRWLGSREKEARSFSFGRDVVVLVSSAQRDSPNIVTSTRLFVGLYCSDSNVGETLRSFGRFSVEEAKTWLDNNDLAQ